jgi:50S ribosomal protein L16 3-hydroxylase
MAPRTDESTQREPLAMLAGLTPSAFMRRHWQRSPLLARRAVPQLEHVVSRAELFALAARDVVESRLVEYAPRTGWSLRHGPFKRASLPRLRTPNWTLLVQGVDLHNDAAHRLLRSFRFVPDARLDDLMISWASDGGGVGPHVDSYDVFLLQAQGRRRWRIAPPGDFSFEPDAPLKILRRFEPTIEHVLEPGDLLYLPPGWAHDGVALGECMTYSIGLRAAARDTLAAELVQRLAETFADARLYADRQQQATATPAEIPASLAAFARDAVRQLVARPDAIARALGEVLSEPKPNVWFEKRPERLHRGGVVLDRRTKMLYDARYIFINGEAVRVRGGDASLLRRLANERRLGAAAVRGANRTVRTLLAEWHAAGWLERTATVG